MSASNRPEAEKLTFEYLGECFDLSEDGRLTWKVRPRYHFPCSASFTNFNKHFAGKQAGSLQNTGYLRVKIMGTVPLGNHHIVFALSRGIGIADLPPVVDHKDRNKLNNKPSNLRAADHQQNMQNKVYHNKIAPGVRQRKSGKFEACITFQGKYRHLGTFETLSSASSAHLEASRELKGEFSPL